ncbi:MAG: Nif11 family protein [Acutalibacteraceae bacterium]
MSIENVKKFYVSASEDAKLVEALKKISEEMQQKSLASDKLNELVSSKIIPLAKERGFDFTADELIAYSQEMIKGLSEEDLAAVSGGMSPRTAAIALAFTLGSSFVAAGVVNMMSNTPTQNQAIMSSSDSAKTANKDTVPKVVKDKTTKVDVDRNTANENQNLSKDRDIQEKLRDKEIVLPGEQAKTTENKSNVEENGKLLETADIENKKDDEINEAKNQNNLAVAESNPVAVNNQIINARGLNNEEEIEGNDQVRPMGQNVNDQNVNNQNGMGQNVNDQNANNQNVNDQRRQEALWLEFLNANNQMRPNANNNVNDQNANNPNANNQNVNDQNVNDQNVNDQNGMGQNVNDQNVNNQNVNDQNGMGQNVNDQNVNNQNVNDQNGMGQNVNDQNANNQNANNQNVNDQNVNNQNGNDQNGMGQNVNDQNANNQNVNDQNVNNQNVNDQNANNQNVNDQNVNNQNVNDQNGMGQNVNNQNANNQNVNDQNANNQNVNNPNEDNEEEDNEEEIIEANNEEEIMTANNQNVNNPNEDNEEEDNEEEIIEANNEEEIMTANNQNVNNPNEDNEEEDNEEEEIIEANNEEEIMTANNQNVNNPNEDNEEEDNEEEIIEANNEEEIMTANNQNANNQNVNNPNEDNEEEDNEEEEIIEANNEEEIMTANSTTTKEALREHVNAIKGRIEDSIRAAFNEAVIANGRSMSVEDATTFAKNITDSVSEEVFKDIVITRKGNIITLSATGEVPGMFWGTNSHTEKATINVDEFVKNLNEESIKNEVKTEIGVIKEAIKTNFREKVRSRSVEYTNADLPIVIENLAEYVEEIENTNDSVVKSVSEDKKLVTVVSEIDGTVKESIDLEKFVNELNTQAREKRMQGIRNLAEDCPGSLKKNMLREKSKQWIDNCILYEIETKICENYEQNATEEVENISEVPEGDQRRIALNLAANIEGNFGGILKDIEENEDNYVIKAQYIAGTTKCFVTIAAKDRSGKIIEHTEEIDMKKEIQNRLSSYKLNYDMFFNGTATEQAEYLLETLSKIETLDEIENVKDIKDNLTDLANQIVIKAENYKKGEHIKKGVLDKNIDYKSAGLFTSLKGDTKAIGKDDNVVVTENAPLVLSGNWKYGEGVGSEGLHKILSFYEQSLNY